VDKDFLTRHKPYIKPTDERWLATKRYGVPRASNPVDPYYAASSGVNFGNEYVVVGYAEAIYKVGFDDLYKRGLTINISEGHKYKDLPQVTISHSNDSIKSFDTIPPD